MLVLQFFFKLGKNSPKPICCVVFIVFITALRDIYLDPKFDSAFSPCQTRLSNTDVYFMRCWSFLDNLWSSNFVCSYIGCGLGNLIKLEIQWIWYIGTWGFLCNSSFVHMKDFLRNSSFVPIKDFLRNSSLILMKNFLRTGTRGVFKFEYNYHTKQFLGNT